MIGPLTSQCKPKLHQISLEGFHKLLLNLLVSYLFSMSSKLVYYNNHMSHKLIYCIWFFPLWVLKFSYESVQLCCFNIHIAFIGNLKNVPCFFGLSCCYNFKKKSFWMSKIFLVTLFLSSLNYVLCCFVKTWRVAACIGST